MRWQEGQRSVAERGAQRVVQLRRARSCCSPVQVPGAPPAPAPASSSSDCARSAQQRRIDLRRRLGALARRAPSPAPRPRPASFAAGHLPAELVLRGRRTRLPSPSPPRAAPPGSCPARSAPRPWSTFAFLAMSISRASAEYSRVERCSVSRASHFFTLSFSSAMFCSSVASAARVRAAGCARPRRAAAGRAPSPALRSAWGRPPPTFSAAISRSTFWSAARAFSFSCKANCLLPPIPAPRPCSNEAFGVPTSSALPKGGSMRFCPRCATPLASQEKGGRERLACPGAECGYVFYDNPLPVVAGLVEHEGEVLLVRSVGWPESWYGLVTGFLERARSRRPPLSASSTRSWASREGWWRRSASTHSPSATSSSSPTTSRPGARSGWARSSPGSSGSRPEKLRPWPVGTGHAVRDWLAGRSVGLRPALSVSLRRPE